MHGPGSQLWSVAFSDKRRKLASKDFEDTKPANNCVAGDK